MMGREKKEYAIFVQNIEEDLPEGKELVLTIKDLTPGRNKYENRVVKAIVSRHPEKLLDSDILEVKS